jgi:formylglycine-generating enzyme required for sulfatase activity
MAEDAQGTPVHGASAEGRSALTRQNWRRGRARGILLAAAIALMITGYAAAQCWRAAPGPDRVAWLKSHAPPGMVLVPAGWFWMGHDDADDVTSAGKRRVWTPSFYLDQYPVSKKQYAKFAPGYHYPKSEADYPVTGLTWSQATAYLKSQGKVLPTEAEWEKSARGADGRTFPWGDSAGHWLDSSVGKRSFRSVRAYPQPASPYGAKAMCGAVWQWARDNINGDPKVHVIRGGAAGYATQNDTTFSRGLEGAGVT